MKFLTMLAVLLSLSFGPVELAQKEDKPPSRKETKALVEEALTLGSRAMGEERARQLAINERLMLLPALTERSEEKWREDLLKQWMDLPGLPATKGDNWYWEEEKRGRFIVGGKTKRAEALLIGMHGGGAGSADAGGAAGSYSGPASKLKWAAIFPQAIEATEHGWTDTGTEEWVWDLVEEARRSFKVDADRVFLAGHSMGGYGSWTLGAHHADRVAALAPSAGAPTPIMDRDSGKVTDIDWGVVPSLRNVPMVVYQSTDDPRVPPEVNQAAVKRVAADQELYGGYENFVYWEVDGRGHDYPPGGPAAHLEKIAGFTREPIQDVVVWQPVLDWKRQFYWLFWEKPAAGAIVEARLDRENNAIAVKLTLHKQSEPGSGLAVLLDERIVDLEREIVVTLNDEEVFRGKPEKRLDVLMDTSTSGDPGRQFTARVPLQ